MDTAEYALGIFDAHLRRAGRGYSELKGQTILEIGPGDSIATAIIAFAHGAKAILVDSGPYASSVTGPYTSLCTALSVQGLRVPNLSGAQTINDVLDACDGLYLTGGLASWRRIEKSSVDLVFSQAVLEHIRRHEFLATQEECCRVMRHNAIASHRVDLRDHLGGALNNLRFDESLWESDWFVRSGFYTNRLQMKDILGASEEAGFSVEVTEVRRWSTLPTPRRKLSKTFASLPEDELNVSGFDVLLRRNPSHAG
jgi:hypothetical protein